MNYKFLLSAGFLSIILVSGCSSNNDYEYDYFEQQGTSNACPSGQYSSTNGEGCIEYNTQTRQVCPAGQYPVPGITGCAPEDEFVNYTKVAADYRAYGERTPRDHLVVQAGAGSNLSATIPPSIEGEVVDYEDEATAISSGAGADLSGSVENGDYDAEDPIEDWLAEEGKSLKQILTEWSDRAGWRLVWNTNRNYTLTAGAMFRGRFADVSSALVRAFARARPAPIATFYKGNRVLVVETMEDENAYE